MPRGVAASDRRIAAALFVLAFVTYAWFFSGGGWNQNAHFDLARALVERQTLHIDGYRVNTGDISWSPVGGEWHAYINKPPGASFLAAVPYALVYAAGRALRVNFDSWQVMTVNAWIVTGLTCGVTGALIPVVLYLYARRRVGTTPLASAAVALAIAFGTIVFPYSTTLMAHVPSALFLLLAFVWLDERPLLAGICAGIAGTCNYLCIPAAAVLAIGALMHSWRGALRFVAGGVPFGILLALYHDWCFGSPFTTAVEVSTNFTEKGRVFGVFALPAREALWGLTFAEYRGLFFSAPVLLLAFAGAFRMRRRELLMIAAIVLLFLFTVSGFNGWSGGSAFGPRYLLTAVPLFAIPMLFVRGRAFAAIGLVLGLASGAQQFLATAVNPTPDSGIRKPLREYYLRQRETSVNAHAVDELVPHFTYKAGSRESTWAARNLGELVTGPGRPLSVLPIALWILGGSALLLATARRA